MKLRNLLFLIVALQVVTAVPAYCQDTRAIKRLFRDAEYYYLLEEYDEAINYYQELLDIDPGNSNVHYLLGHSYIEAGKGLELAIPHLQNAVKEVTEDYREGSYKERKAPLLAWFMLGRAYHSTEMFDKAIEAYQSYREKIDYMQFAEIEYVKRQIKSCELAKSMVKNSRDLYFKELDEIKYRNFPVSHPVVSGNDSLLIFSIEKPDGSSIAMTSREGDKWSKPRIIDSELQVEGMFFPVSVSFKGDELFLVYRDYMTADLFVSKKDGRRWSPAVPLGKEINSRYLETHASISADGELLYFTSNRPDGWGGLDIYRSRRAEDGTWMEPENLGFGINTYYNEETPFISQNDSVLYFSSEGMKTMGGYDVFHTRIDEEGYFTVPQNLGYPISTTMDDLFYNPGWQGTRGYLAKREGNESEPTQLYAVLKEGPDGESEGAIAQTVVNTSSEGNRRLSEYYYIMNNILFSYNESILDNEAIREAERIYAMMKQNPSVEIELTGHTDSRGSARYNRILSEKRAQSVKNYLVQRGIESERIILLAAGEEDPVAINKYEDGSDAPEGRLLNRNVSIRISNMATRQVRLAEVFVPRHLVPDNDKVYSVLLTESKQMIDTMPGEILGQPVSLVSTDESMMYTLGKYDDRSQAQEALNMVLDNGFPNAYVTEKRDFEHTIRKRTMGDKAEKLQYTIQIIALRNPVDPSYFKDLNVRQFVGRDGFHRYVFGVFESINEAIEVLPLVKDKGYEGAFVKPLSHYEK